MCICHFEKEMFLILDYIAVFQTYFSETGKDVIFFYFLKEVNIGKNCASFCIDKKETL